MKDTTVMLTISHEGELPKGLLQALEAKAYDWTMAHGVACGEVVAKESIKATQAAHDAVWTAVPVEPTEDMFVAGMEADCCGRPSVDDDTHVRSIWNAMLGVAPPAPNTAVLLQVKEMRDE